MMMTKVAISDVKYFFTTPAQRVVVRGFLRNQFIIYINQCRYVPKSILINKVRILGDLLKACSKLLQTLFRGAAYVII